MIEISQLLEKLTNKLIGWLEAMVIMTPNILLALVIMIVFGLVSKYSRRVVYKLLSKISKNEAVNRLASNFFRYGVISLGAFLALTVVQLHDTVMALLAGVGVVGLALGFAFQDIAANFISGIFIAVRKPFEIGDIVESNGFMGTVQEISLRSSVIRTFTGQEITLPNKSIFESPLENFSTGTRRVDLGVGVSYGDDLQKVEDLTLAAVQGLPMVLSHKPVDLYYTEFGDSSINFTVRFWVKFQKQPDYLKGVSEAIKAIKAIYDREDITIPFPIRTLDFGIKGGETLDTTLIRANSHGPS